MAGRLEFQDALIDLFDAHKAHSTRSVNELKGKQVLMSLSFYCRILFGSKTPHLITPQVRDFVRQFEKVGATIVFVDDGIEDLSNETLVDIFTRMHWMRNRFFYFKMIASILNKISDEDQEFFRKNELMRTLGSTDTVGTLCYRVIWSNDLESAFDNQGLKLIKAPRSSHDQLLYFHSINSMTELFCEPTVFLKSEITRVFQKVDFDNDEISDFDFSKLSVSLKIDPKMLRKCLFGVMVFFQLSPQLKNRKKFLDSFVENIANFPSVYAQNRLAHLEILQEQFIYLNSRLQDDEINHNFAAEISLIYNFNIESVMKIYGYFFKGEVLSNESELISFPCSDFAEGELFLRDTVDTNLVRYFCNREINEEILHMYTRFRDYTMTVLFPKLNVVEFEFANKIYYKEQMDWVMSQYIKLFPPKKKLEMKFQYFFETPIKLITQTTEETFLFPENYIRAPITLFNSLFQFWSSVEKRSPFRTLKSFKSGNKPDALLFINLVLLHRLKYISIEKQTLMIPAVAFVKANPSEFGEELVLLFELIRNNLLMPDFLVDGKSIYRDFEGFMLGNVLDEILYNDSICSAFLKNIRTGGSKFSKGIQEFDPTSEAFECTLDMGFDVTHVLDLPRQSIRIGVLKSLTAFYRIIKEFQKEYKNFYDLGNNSFKADLILNHAFENYVLKDVLICSRIFSFILEDYTISDLFVIDTYHFQHVFSVVQKSLQMVADACKINFYYNTASEVHIDFKSWLQKNLPFRKNYSVDGGKFLKIICTKFLILESLQAEDTTFASEYAKKMQPEWLQSAYGVTFDIKIFLEKGKTLVDKLFVFLQTITSMSESSSYDYLLEHLPRISRLLARVIKFFGH